MVVDTCETKNKRRYLLFYRYQQIAPPDVEAMLADIRDLVRVRFYVYYK